MVDPGFHCDIFEQLVSATVIENVFDLNIFIICANQEHLFDLSIHGVNLTLQPFILPTDDPAPIVLMEWMRNGSEWREGQAEGWMVGGTRARGKVAASIFGRPIQAVSRDQMWL